MENISCVAAVHVQPLPLSLVDCVPKLLPESLKASVSKEIHQTPGALEIAIDNYFGWHGCGAR